MLAYCYSGLGPNPAGGENLSKRKRGSNAHSLSHLLLLLLPLIFRNGASLDTSVV
ncbi:MAG: hypothetical protein AB2693_19440 [Candidatus Thiodiazotropha sp.]